MSSAVVSVPPASEPALGSVRPKAPIFSPLGQRDQIFLLLLLGAVGENGPRAEGDMGGKDHARAAVHTGQLLHRDGVTQGVKTGAPYSLG